MALSIEPQAACTLKTNGYGFSHAGFSASTLVPCSILRQLCLSWALKRNDESFFSCRRTSHISRTKAYRDRNWKASFFILFSDGMRFSDFQWFQLVPIWILLHWCNRFVKGLISWRDRLCFASTAALVRPKQGSANFLTLACTVTWALPWHAGLVSCFANNATRLDFCIPSSVHSYIARLGTLETVL